MYTINRASQRSNVAVSTIRAWERRYGVTAPARTPSGYRLYDDRDIDRLIGMRRLIEDGWSARSAAEAIIERGADPPTQANDDPRRRGSDESEAESGSLSDRLVNAAAAVDPAAVGRVLDEMFVRGSFEMISDELLFPALREVGRAWAAGQVGVAGEHLTSHAAIRRISAVLEAAGIDRGVAGSIVVGLPPGSRHEIGALAFAAAARRQGMAVSYLGSDLPIDDWVAATASARAAVVGIVTDNDLRSALEAADAVKRNHPAVLIALGGRAAPHSTDYLRLSEDMGVAVTELRNALDGGRH